MALSWNETKDRAIHFSKEWAYTSNEEADAKPFLNAFFEVFGVPRKKNGTFEHKVKKINDAHGYIDLLWNGTVLTEMKSQSKNLYKAGDQAYRPQPFTSEAKRMEFLFELYEKYTADLITKEKKKK